MRWWKRLPKVNEDKEKAMQEELSKEERLSFKDYFAMFTSAYLIFIPMAILVLFLLYLLIRVWFL